MALGFQCGEVEVLRIPIADNTVIPPDIGGGAPQISRRGT